MKNQKGMGHIMLIISILVIIFIIIGIGYFIKIQVEKEKLETYETDMLLIQGKVKILSQEATIQKNEELLQGTKVEDNLEEESVKLLLEKSIISQEEENFSNYYILEKTDLEEMGLENITIEDEYYIVNYETDEIIYAKGITIGKNTYYKLSELVALEEQEEQNEEEIMQEE